jgi:hypothetical protein
LNRILGILRVGMVVGAADVGVGVGAGAGAGVSASAGIFIEAVRKH